MNKLTALAGASAIYVALGGIASAQTLETLETTTGWDGLTGFGYFGPTNFTSFGQTFTPTATQTTLQDFTYYLVSSSGTSPQAEAYVYQWNPGTSSVVGNALFQSAVFQTTTANVMTAVTISTGGITLVAGTQYVIFLTTAGLPVQPAGSMGLGGQVAQDVYLGGNLVAQISGSLADLSQMAWTTVGRDLVFIYTFGMLAPPPPPRPVYGPLNENQQAVANPLLSYFDANGSLPAGFYLLTARDLSQLSGEVATSAVSGGLDAAYQFLAQMSDPSVTDDGSAAAAAYAPLAYSSEPANLSSPGALAALGAEVPAASDAANAALAMSSAHAADPAEAAMAKRWAMWGSVYGNAGRIGGDAVVGSADLTARNWGIASGFERSFGDSRLGLSLGGAGSTFSLSGGLGSGTAGIFNAGIYGSHSFGNAYVSGALAYGWNNVRTTRNVPGDTLTANFNAHSLAGRLETGYRFGSTSAITPYVALQGANYVLPGYTETSALGGPFALVYGRQSEAALRTELGARFEHTLPTSDGSLKFSARAAWAYNAINDRAVSAAFAALPGQTFTINGARPARSAVLLDLGVEAAFDSGLSAKLSFNGEFSRNVSAYGASAKLIWRW